MIVDIVFAAFPGPGNECVFVEAETLDGRSVSIGEWVQRRDGLAALRVSVNDESVHGIHP